MLTWQRVDAKAMIGKQSPDFQDGQSTSCYCTNLCNGMDRVQNGAMEIDRHHQSCHKERVPEKGMNGSTKRGNGN
jgi:hypothetical protein